jgi:hypothetical protein
VFGLSYGPAVFHSYLYLIFCDLLDISVVIYFENILVFSGSMEELDRHVFDVILGLRRNLVQASQKKCVLAATRSGFLAHTLSGGVFVWNLRRLF